MIGREFFGQITTGVRAGILVFVMSLPLLFVLNLSTLYSDFSCQM